MEKDRLAAFSDGVIAVIITLMVLDLKVPREPSFAALAGVLPVFLSYILSFVSVAIYWNNHHHFFQIVPRVTGAILWANINLLFWLSLIPFATAWMGEHYRAPVPTAVYGVSLLMPALAWYGMQLTIIHAQGKDFVLAHALGRDIKGKLSPLLYGAGVALAFVDSAFSDICYSVVALMWLVPDRRIEAVVGQD